MEENKIIVHQAYYGEVDRAHSCIIQTVDDKELKSFLISFTDRPAALPPNIELEPYLSGSIFSKYYIFSKTFPDAGASRSGMVFTHVLIIDINDIGSIIKIDDILNNLVINIPRDRNQLSKFELNIPIHFLTPNEFQPKYVQQSISNLIKGKKPILFSGDINHFQIILQQLWNSTIKDFKKKIKFRASFTPSDIIKINDLTIVSIQKEFLPKWINKCVILDDEIQIEVKNEAEKLFLGIKKNNLFSDFLKELNADLNNLLVLNKCEEVYKAFVDIDKIDDADSFRIQLRQISQISPSSKDGTEIKNKFLDKIYFFYSSGKDINLKALRNIDWNAFDKGELRVKTILSEFISSKIKAANENNIEILSELLKVSIEESNKTWWHQIIFETFKNLFLNYNEIVFQNIWKMIDFSKANFINIFELFDSSNNNETNLRKGIPSVLKDATVKDVTELSKKRKWYLLHADLVLKSFNLEKAILKQLELEIDLSFEDSFGVKYIADKINDIEILQMVLNQYDEKLISISVQRILKDKTLLNDIDVKIPIWIKIWSLVLNDKLNISYGIEIIEHKVISDVFELIKQNIVVPNIIIELISKSIYADLSNYNDRIDLWDKLPKEFINKFIELTSEKIVEKIILGKIEIKSVEKIILNEITSDLFMSSFLNKNKNEISNVIKIYSILPNLKDKYLADYIHYYANSISEIDATNLGNLVSRNRLSLSAKSIYDKSKFKDSFRLAFELCKNLVQIDFLDSLFGFSGKSKVDKKSKDYKTKTNMKERLPLVVILTAIKEEYSAVRIHLKDIEDCDSKGTAYEKGVFELDGFKIAEVIIRECGAKNNIAAQEAERAINNFRPKMMLFVGIAGSRKPNDFKIGDVIFAEKIYSYEGGKATKESFKARPEAESPTYTLIEKAKKERGKEDWKQLIKGSYEIKPNADIGIIASGEQLIDHHNTEIGIILKEHYNDSSAVEMEGYGFVKAIKRQGMESSNTIYGVVRGISDIVEEDSNQKEIEKDRRPENAKIFASDTAAAFAFWLIKKTF